MKLVQMYRPLWEYSYKSQYTSYMNERVALLHLSVDSWLQWGFDVLAINE